MTAEINCPPDGLGTEGVTKPTDGVQGLPNGLDTEGVTKPYVFQNVHATSGLENDALGIITETNPSGIDSPVTPEAGADGSVPARTTADPADQSCAGVARNQKPHQGVGLVETPSDLQFSSAEVLVPETKVQPGLVTQCLDAFDALPNVASNPNKESQRDCVKKSFYAGMYSHGGISDLRSTCRENAEPIKLFSSLIRAVHPKLHFTSLVVLDGSQTGIHRDTQNAYAPNLVIPLTHFSGGELFLEDSRGQLHNVGELTLRGTKVSLSNGPVAFDARSVNHGGLPSPDRRVVLVAYCLKGTSRLRPEARMTLSQLGFRLPKTEPAVQPVPRLTTGFPDLRPLGFRPQPLGDALPALKSRRLLFIELLWLRRPFCRLPGLGVSGLGH